MNFSNTESNIETKNLILEPINLSHAIKLFELLQSEKLYQYIPHDPPKSLSKLEERYSRWSNRKSEDSTEIWLNYAVYHRTYGDYAGTVQATIQINGPVYIAYETFPHLWKQGIAKEACLGLIHHLFENYGVLEITAHADTRNEASLKLLESLGFVRHEIILGADEFKGAVSDEYVYKLSRN